LNRDKNDRAVFFDGIEAKRGHFFEKFIIKNAFMVDPNVANAMIFLANHTVMGAKFTLHNSTFKLFKIKGLFHSQLNITNLPHSL